MWRHVQQARYSLQVVKCLDPDCCEPFVSDWLTVFPKRFIPSPVVYQYSKYGMTAVEPTECFANLSKYEFAPLTRRVLLKKSPESTDDMYFPFDLYCPSMEGKLLKGVCSECEYYWPSQAAMKRYQVMHQENKRKNSGNESAINFEREGPPTSSENSDSEPEVEAVEDRMPLFNNIFDIFKSPVVGDI